MLHRADSPDHGYTTALDPVKSLDYKGGMRVSGKPQEGPTALRPNRYVRLPPEIDDALQQLADEQDRPIGRIIRDVLRDGLEKSGRLKPRTSHRKAS